MVCHREWDSRPWVLSVSVFLAIMACCSQAAGQDLGERKLPEPKWTVAQLPCGLAYECTDALRFRNAEVSWKFSFDPKRSAIYDIVHWRVAYYGRAGAGGPQEYVAKITFPLGQAPCYRLFRRVKIRDWRRLWLRHRWTWREFKHGTPAYRGAAHTLGRVIMMARVLRGGADPAMLEF